MPDADPKTLARRVLELDEWLNTPGSPGDDTTMEDGVFTLHELADGAAPLARAYLDLRAELDHLRSDAGPDSCADRAQRHERLKEAASTALQALALSPDPDRVEQAIAELRRGLSTPTTPEPPSGYRSGP